MSEKRTAARAALVEVLVDHGVSVEDAEEFTEHAATIGRAIAGKGNLADLAHAEERMNALIDKYPSIRREEFR